MKTNFQREKKRACYSRSTRNFHVYEKFKALHSLDTDLWFLVGRAFGFWGVVKNGKNATTQPQSGSEVLTVSID